MSELKGESLKFSIHYLFMELELQVTNNISTIFGVIKSNCYVMYEWRTLSVS